MAHATTKWRLIGHGIASCNCAWGCPCQFNALPTRGNCEALAANEIREGYFADTRLDGLRFAVIYQWPGPIHEGKGTKQLIVDERASGSQREALVALDSGKYGHPRFEIFAAVCPNVEEPIHAPIEFDFDMERRRARVRVGNFGEIDAEPIKNPVTGAEHRARIDLPQGFEYKLAEMGNTTHLRVRRGKLAFEHQNSYAQFMKFDWDHTGATR